MECTKAVVANKGREITQGSHNLLSLSEPALNLIQGTGF